MGQIDNLLYIDREYLYIRYHKSGGLNGIQMNPVQSGSEPMARDERDQRICVISLVVDDCLGVQAFNQDLGLRNVSHFAARRDPVQQVLRASTVRWILVLSPPRAPEYLRPSFFGRWLRTVGRVPRYCR